MNYGIGIVGLGQITEVHRDGYSHYGHRVVAGYDISPQARDHFASQTPCATVYDDLKALLADENVDIIDLAAPHPMHIRKPLLEEIAKAGKPVLLQKPFAYTYAEALELLEIIKTHKITAMINQNNCFVPAILDSLKALVEEQRIGTPFLYKSGIAFCFDVPVDHWFGKGSRWWTSDFAVHALAVMHLMFGPPESVYAVTGRDPKQSGVDEEGFLNTILRYKNGLSANLFSTGTYYGPGDGCKFDIEIQGPDGVLSIKDGEGCTWSLRKNRDTEQKHITEPTNGVWFPHAFGLVMEHFQQALTAGKQPWCSAQDNLYVMAVVDAIYTSSAENRVVQLQEIMKERYDPDYGPGYHKGYYQWKVPQPAESPELIRTY